MRNGERDRENEVPGKPVLPTPNPWLSEVKYNESIQQPA
jgi:hypothetical protein